VTRAISAKLATLAKSLEQGDGEASSHPPEQVAGFLMRCLFTMFAEDVGLLPPDTEPGSFSQLLKDMREDSAHLPHLLSQLWADMNNGSAFSPVLRAPIPHFNGGLFADPSALPLTRPQIDLLIDAARADWREVEPAIFGTLLERALDPIERHKLGAHYTPRAYVERLVLPTVIEPLRADWANVQASAFRLDQDSKRDQAIEMVRAFHRQLCTVRVLDPACGSGNFLYVTLEHLKRLEGEVLEALADLGFTQQGLELEGGTVSPEQMLGLETNPRAARIAEAVLWIGYLQWHFRTFAKTPPREPLLKDAHNIENRDAVLAWDAIEYAQDDAGRPITRWDGRTMKRHPVTGEPVPDESAQSLVEQYINPRAAEWPKADFVIGNPPFIGASTMRRALGDGYVEALRSLKTAVPESADYVMHWWHKAGELVRTGAIQRFGLITTNSLRQTFNRRVIAHQIQQKQPLSLAFAIPDHPWVDTADGAAVRIAMTVGQPGSEPGRYLSGIKTYIATVETSKHRFFIMVDRSILPDNMLIGIAVDDPQVLGVLSSRVHIAWALRTGGRLGIGNDPRYNKTRCFGTFPFPTQTEAPQTEPSIAELAGQIDAHRKRQQELHPTLTLTNLYNVLERLRRIAHPPPGATEPEPPLTVKERSIHDQGLVSILGQLHDELDAAVLTAYGWEDLAPALVGRPGGTTPYPDKPAEQAAAEEELLTRLVALNRQRAAEEAQGRVRWLRPTFQDPTGATRQQTEANVGVTVVEPAASAKQPWPKTLPAQFQAVRDRLAEQPMAADAEQIARQFKRAPTKKVAELLETLAALGQVQQPQPGRFAA